MRAGTLRHEIALYALVKTRDTSNGAVAESWELFEDRVRADVRFPNGLETVKANAPIVITKASIRIRYRPGVLEDMRVVHDGKNYDIKNVLPDVTGKRWLDLACESGANNG